MLEEELLPAMDRFRSRVEEIDLRQEAEQEELVHSLAIAAGRVPLRGVKAQARMP